MSPIPDLWNLNARVMRVNTEMLDLDTTPTSAEDPHTGLLSQRTSPAGTGMGD